uniref:Uncharacterized protein n=1 Tax=Heterorhabditis bacteriophora TaxID=37862 RepID=A0A1I7WBC8_HETBA
MRCQKIQPHLLSRYFKFLINKKNKIFKIRNIVYLTYPKTLIPNWLSITFIHLCNTRDKLNFLDQREEDDYRIPRRRHCIYIMPSRSTPLYKQGLSNNCFKQVSSLNFYEFTPIISVTVVVSLLLLPILLKWLQIDSSPGGLLHLTALKLVNIYIYVHWNCRWKAL